MRLRARRFPCLLVGGSLCIPLAAAPADPAGALVRHVASRMSMGCAYAIVAYGRDGAALPRIVDAAFDEVDRIDRLMSHYKPESPLSRLNRDAAGGTARVDPELLRLIAGSRRCNRAAHSPFDIT